MCTLIWSSAEMLHMHTRQSILQPETLSWRRVRFCIQHYTLTFLHTNWEALRRLACSLPGEGKRLVAGAAASLNAAACAGGATARSSAVRSRVRSAGARQRRGGASADGSPRTPAAPQELRENDQVPRSSLPFLSL